MTPTPSALRDQVATLVSRILNESDPLTLDQARAEAGRMAGEVFDAAGRDCGDSACRYATNRGGQRTNGGCRCDECRECGANLLSVGHREGCSSFDAAAELRREGERS